MSNLLPQNNRYRFSIMEKVIDSSSPLAIGLALACLLVWELSK